MSTKKSTIDKEESLGRLGLMLSLALARLKQVNVSKDKKEELIQIHRFCRTLIEDYFDKK